MNQRMFEELARQRHAEMHRLSGSRLSGGRLSSGRLSGGRLSSGRLSSGRLNGRLPGTQRVGTGQALRARQSLRTRTGWKLVDLGLKLAVQPDPRAAAAARPARS